MAILQVFLNILENIIKIKMIRKTNNNTMKKNNKYSLMIIIFIKEKNYHLSNYYINNSIKMVFKAKKMKKFFVDYAIERKRIKMKIL